MDVKAREKIMLRDGGEAVECVCGFVFEFDVKEVGTRTREDSYLYLQVGQRSRDLLDAKLSKTLEE